MTRSHPEPGGLIPRVHMHYRTEVNGVAHHIELPFLTGVIADLAGKPVDPLPPFGERRFVEVDSEGFDAFMAETGPRAAFAVSDHINGEGTLAVELQFRQIDDFAPQAIVSQIKAIERAVLAVRDVTDLRKPMGIAGILDEILHHPEFVQLERSWRALYRMVISNESDGLCPIRVLVASKAELAKVLKRFKGTWWDQSPLFKRIYLDGYASARGEPFGCVLLDYEFDHSPPDVEMLGELSKIAAAAHSPMLAAASSVLFQMESWAELENPHDLRKIFTTPEYAAWRNLRESDDCRYLALVMPRYLEREPWRGEALSPGGPVFDEQAGPYHALWANPAYLLATAIQRSFRIHGWFDRFAGLRQGGAIEGLAEADVSVNGERLLTLGPLEKGIDDRRLDELSQLGMVTLAPCRARGTAVIQRATGLSQPAEYDDPEATETARLAARLDYLLMTSRVAHFVKVIVRDAHGSLTRREELQALLNSWLAQYAEPPAGAPGSMACTARPLAAAEIVVEEIPDSPGYFSSKFYLKPRGAS